MPRKLPPPKNAEKIWFELLPKAAERQHGRHVYMFRNTHTNQILYTLYPMIWQRSLRQLSFIGKHSVPPKVRPDLWTAHCRIGPFPTAEQGLDAIKKLQEFRKLHQLSWDKTNPEWKNKPKKTLIRLLMNQRRTATADLAQVLTIQQKLGSRMATAVGKRRKDQDAFLEKRWAEMRTTAESAEAKIKELEKLMADCRSQLGDQRVKAKPDEKEVARLNKLMTHHRRDIRQLIWTQKMVQQHDEAHTKLEEKYEADVAEQRTIKAKLLAEGKTEEADAIRIPTMNSAIYVNEIRSSLLPKSLKSLTKPFSVRGIECHWADLHDAEYSDSWPQSVVQAPMSHIENRKVNGFITEDEYEAVRAQERYAVQTAASRLAENMRRQDAGEPLLDELPIDTIEAPKEKTGIMKYLPTFSNPFKRSSATL